MGEVCVRECRHGTFMFYKTDHYIGGCLDRYGEYSEGELLLWEQFVRPGMTVIDVGANIGCFTIPLAQMVGPQGRVYAIEPQRQIYQMLVGNLALNEISNTFVLHGGLSDKPGKICVPSIDYDAVGNFGGVAMAPATDFGDGTGNWSTAAGERVPCLTLDSLLPHDSGVMTPPPVHFIKIDVEGMERAVLQGGVNMIRRFKPILYVENDRKEKSAEVISWLMTEDYRMFWHTPPLFYPNNFRGDPEDIFRVVSINMLCVHRSINLTINGLEEVTTPQAESGAGLVR